MRRRRACSRARGVVAVVRWEGAGACEKTGTQVAAAAEHGDDDSCGLLRAVKGQGQGAGAAPSGLFASPWRRGGRS